MTRLHLMTWSLERSPVKSRLSRVPWSRSPRAPPVGASYTGASLRRSRSVPWPVALDVQLSGPIIMLLLFGRRGHRQISTVTRFQAHPSGFLHWSRSPRAPPIGAFYTGVLLAALSIGSSAVCTLRTVLHSSGGAVDRAGYSSALRQTRAQTNQYCNPNPGSPLWVLALGTRSSLSCGGGSFLTGAVLKARSARWCLWLLLPIGASTQASCRVAVLRPKPRSPSLTPSDS